MMMVIPLILVSSLLQQLRLRLSGSDYCVYMTKQALDFSITPTWFQVTPIYSTPIERISITPDGNHMFFSRGNNLYRTDNLNLNVDTIKDTYKFLDVGKLMTDPNGDNDNAVVNTIKLNTLFNIQLQI